MTPFVPKGSQGHLLTPSHWREGQIVVTGYSYSMVASSPMVGISLHREMCCHYPTMMLLHSLPLLIPYSGKQKIHPSIHTLGTSSTGSPHLQTLFMLLHSVSMVSCLTLFVTEPDICGFASFSLIIVPAFLPLQMSAPLLSPALSSANAREALPRHRSTQMPGVGSLRGWEGLWTQDRSWLWHLLLGHIGWASCTCLSLRPW